MPKSKVNFVWSRIKEQYNSIRELSVAINRAVGSLVSLFLLESIFYYSVRFDEMLAFSKLDWKEMVTFTFWLIDSSLILYFCAESCHQLNYFLDWVKIPENMKGVGDFEYLLIIQELSSNSVAIKGSNVHAVTYPLIASVSYATCIIVTK